MTAPDDVIPRPEDMARLLGWSVTRRDNKALSWADLMAEAGRRYEANAPLPAQRKASE